MEVLVSVESSRRKRAISRFGPRAALFVLVVSSAHTAAAQPRLDAASTSCSILQSTVSRDGGAVIQTGPFLWDRFVTRCSQRARETPAYLRTRDNPQCLVGYTCVQNTN